MTRVPEPWASSFDKELGELGVNGRTGAPPGASKGAEKGRQRFFSCLPPGYTEETAPQDAATDWLEMFGLLSEPPDAGKAGPPDAANVASAVAPRPPASPGALSGQPGRLLLCPSRGEAPGDFRLRRIGLSRVELSSFLPVLESFGLVTVEAVPWHFAIGPQGPDGYVDDIGVRVDTPLMAPGFDLALGGERLVEALQAVLAGQGELSPLNRLVLGAGLDWREVNLLDAYRAYRQVVGGPRSGEDADAMSRALVTFPPVAAAVVRLFASLLVPDPSLSANEAHAGVADALALVPDLEHDHALREVVSLVEATTRSNWALRGETIALKFASRSLDFLPAPRPMAETFVWSPWFEAVHVRFGPVARGGIRWSDRQTDLRGEVLGLARAQVKKNSLIVPTGAKGGFALRGNAGAGQEAGKAAYGAFIGGLLDITDTIVGGKVVHPQGVVCRDGDDPYLVVAPDKGTAHFSDVANSISEERDFWLGDAFASGGSHGYDHKALAITAKGAWTAVRRHFRALGMDSQRERLKVIGVGDMSGDVFGNGMLQSSSICLLAAFDHRNIFVDPSPDPGRSFGERSRLSRLERSSWQDYDLRAASKGAAVYDRHAKQVELSPEARAVLGARPGPMSPLELVKDVLGAPVDLVFFGGIGTFVKALGESDIDVDDRADDDVRVTADQLRARVVAEGANLAVTQRARVSYSRRGGRVNADFIDNAAGVVMSDHEVNLKILLGLAVRDGRLDADGRDGMLVGAQGAVSRSVLGEVGRSIVALERAAASSAEDLPAYEALIEDLVGSGFLDRDVEVLPDAEELARRKQAGAGLSRPELAVLLAYARSEVARSVEGSVLAGDDALRTCAVDYFPPAPREAFSDLVPDHPLFRQLVSSQVANQIVEQVGGIWAHEVASETGRQLWEPAAAYWSAREVLGAAAFFDELDAVDWSLPVEAETALRDHLGAALRRLARWYLSRHKDLRPGEIITSDRPVARQIYDGRLAAGPPAAARLSALGVPEDMASRAERLGWAAVTGELADVARTAERDLPDVLEAYLVIEEGLSLSRLQDAVSRQDVPDRWQHWQLDLLSDDIARIRSDAVIRALRSRPATPGADAAREWLAAQAASLSRASKLIQRVGPASLPNFWLLTLAVRALGEAVRA